MADLGRGAGNGVAIGGLLLAALAGCGSPSQKADGGPTSPADGSTAEHADAGGAPGDGGDAGALAAAPATAGQACQQLNEAAAQLATRCQGGTLADWRAYETSSMDCAAYDRHVAEGLVEYRPAGWAACLQKYQLACAQAFPYPCQFEILFGKVPDGQGCLDFEVCGPVSTCLNLSDGACGGVCARFGLENEACGVHCGDGPPCIDGAYCTSGLTCVDGTCVASRKLGEACGGPQHIGCAAGLFCDADPADPESDGVCASHVSGGPCRSDDGCPANQSCQAGTCAARRTVGAPCADAPTACVPWTSCDVNGSQACVLAGRSGQPCPTLPSGGAFAQCLAGTCAGDVCVPLSIAGGSCASAACAEGTFCDATSSTCLACPAGGSPGNDAGGGAGSDGGGSPGSDAGGAGTDAETDAGACTDLVGLGARVTEVAATGTPPAPAGGQVADGTYVLTKWEIYPPGSANVPAQHQITFRLAGGRMDIAFAASNATATFATVGTTATITYTCALSGAFDQGYTAMAGGLLFIDPQGNVQTYVLH